MKPFKGISGFIVLSGPLLFLLVYFTTTVVMSNVEMSNA